MPRTSPPPFHSQTQNEVRQKAVKSTRSDLNGDALSDTGLRTCKLEIRIKLFSMSQKILV